MTIRKITTDAIASGSITESLLHIDVSNKVNAAYATANTANSAGRYIVGWYSVAPQSSATYTHLKTSLWGGGSPYGNIDFIMGGFVHKWAMGF